MKTALAITIMALLLAACDDKKEREAFSQNCAASGFDAKQCVFLYVVAKKAADDADAANFSAGLAVGLASIRR